MEPTHPRDPGAGAHAPPGPFAFPPSPLLAGTPPFLRALVIQERLLAELDAHTRRWFERRRAAWAGTLEAVGTVPAAGPEALRHALGLVPGLAGRAMELATAEAQDAASLADRCARQLIDGGPATGPDMLPRPGETARAPGT